MKELSTKERIASALLGNKNGYLTVEQIAEIGFDVQYGKQTKKHLNSVVKRNMPHAITYLYEEYGVLVAIDKEPTKNGSKISRKKIIGYKIANKDNEKDVAIINQNVVTKEEQLNIFEEQRTLMIGRAKDTGLLDE